MLKEGLEALIGKKVILYGQETTVISIENSNPNMEPKVHVFPAVVVPTIEYTKTIFGYCVFMMNLAKEKEPETISVKEVFLDLVTERPIQELREKMDALFLKGLYKKIDKRFDNRGELEQFIKEHVIRRINSRGVEYYYVDDIPFMYLSRSNGYPVKVEPYYNLEYTICFTD